MKTRCLLCVLLLVGCDDSTPADAGGGGSDSGTALDAGGGGADAGDTDAGDTDAGGVMDAGDTDAGDTDAGDTDAGGAVDAGSDAGLGCPDLMVQDDGSGVSGGVGIPPLVLSEIAPGAFIELFNTTGEDIELAMNTYHLYSPVDELALATHAPTTIVPAGGYATVPWPTAFTDTNAGGEIMLYRNNAFSAGGNMLDFVCWGTNPHETRMTFAVTAGKWRLGCAAALTAGSIARNVMTEGTTLGDYDTTGAPTPMSCAP